MAAALVLGLGAGFVLAILIPLAAATPSWGSRLPRLIQAHGWIQLQGFVGLFVAGMALRLIPRLCGRRPLPAALVLTLLVLLASGAVLRLFGQVILQGRPGNLALLLAGALAAAGMLGTAASLALALARSSRRGQGWRASAWAAVAWWMVWAALTVATAVRASGQNGLVPANLDRSATWVVLLGAIGNLVWTVQVGSVPVFYGRRPPVGPRLLVPILLFYLGLFIVLASPAAAIAEVLLVRRSGLALTGAAMLWLAPLCGAVRGSAHRLHAASQPAAGFLVMANRWAMLAGCLLLAAAAITVSSSGLEIADGLEDAAQHAIGLGLVTTLVVGMARP